MYVHMYESFIYYTVSMSNFLEPVWPKSRTNICQHKIQQCIIIVIIANEKCLQAQDVINEEFEDNTK